MARAAIGERWDRQSALMCLLANINRDPKRTRKPYEPSDFNCFTAASTKPMPATIASKKNGNWKLFKDACRGAGWFKQPSNSTLDHSG